MILSLTVICTLSFRSYEISCIVIVFTGFSWNNRWADILTLKDSWWLSWLWKQSFSKTEKKFFNFANLFFLFFFLLPNLVIYRSNMTLWVSSEGFKRDLCLKIYFFKECVMTLLTSTPVFHKKVNYFDFCHIWRSFCRRKTYSG